MPHHNRKRKRASKSLDIVPRRPANGWYGPVPDVINSPDPTTKMVSPFRRGHQRIPPTTPIIIPEVPIVAEHRIAQEIESATAAHEAKPIPAAVVSVGGGLESAEVRKEEGMRSGEQRDLVAAGYSSDDGAASQDGSSAVSKKRPRTAASRMLHKKPLS